MPRFVVAAAVAVAASALVAVLHSLGALGRIELLAYDARLLSGVGRSAPGDDVVVAWIDQAAIDHVRRQSGTHFPWPRSIYEQVLDYLRQGGAKAVAFDLLFTEPSVVAEDDRTFGEALAKTRGDVLAFKFVGYRDDGFDDAETAAMQERGIIIAAGAGLPIERGFTLPIAEIASGADLLGFVNVRADADKVHRGYDLLRSWRGKAYPSLALAAAMAASGNSVEFDGATLRLGGKALPVDAGARLQLAFRGGPLTFSHVQLVNILESMVRIDAGEAPIYPAERFRDKIVLIGVNAEGYADVVPTPLSLDFPGVELHATALDNILRGDPLRRTGFDLPLGLVGAGLAVAAVFLLPGAVGPALALVALLAALAIAAFGAFASGVLVPMAAPAAGVLLAGGGAFVWRLTVEGRQRRELRAAFASYMAPEVVAEVLANPDAVQLGGEARQVTVLFTDLAGFTGLAEHLRPQEMVAFLNDYLTRMCDCVLVQRGIIDKFIGDAIMALFGAPVGQIDHPARAVRAALAMQSEMQRINTELQAAGRTVVRTRIGIHAGEAVVGNMGSSKRFDYTAIGDTVNLASRLEGANKAFGTLCLVSDAAWRAAGTGVIGREVGQVRVLGRQQPILVHEPLAVADAAAALDRDYFAGYNAALLALREHRRDDAKRAFAALALRRPDDVLVARYVERLAEPAWDGVFSLDSK